MLLTLIGIDAQYRENALVDWVFNRTNGSWSMQVVNSYNDRLSFSKIPKARIPYQLRYLQETKYFGQNRASCGTAHKIWQRIPLPIF